MYVIVIYEVWRNIDDYTPYFIHIHLFHHHHHKFIVINIYLTISYPIIPESVFERTSIASSNQSGALIDVDIVKSIKKDKMIRKQHYNIHNHTTNINTIEDKQSSSTLLS